MAMTALGKVLEEVKRLTPEEQRQLREAIDQLLSPGAAPPTEEQFERELVESGILDEVPPLPGPSEPIRKRIPIEVRGKPLSETIVEESASAPCTGAGVPPTPSQAGDSRPC